MTNTETIELDEATERFAVSAHLVRQHRFPPHAARGVALKRVKVTHIHPIDHRGRQRVTHPTLWEWTDEEGIQRYYDTKKEALEAIASAQS